VSARGRAWLERAALCALPLVIVVLLTAFRFEPFTLRGDGPVYYLPVIRTTTDALLSGRFPEVLWQLGAGWTPFEAAQIGLGYPPYLLVGVLTKLVGRPLAFLEISAVLHLALAGILVRELSPPSVDPRTRFYASVLAIVQPAPVLLGMPWHAYLAAYPWGIALTLLLWLRDFRDRRVAVMIPVTSALLFWVGHPHLFIWGWFLAGIGMLVLRRPTLRSLLEHWRVAAATALPVLAPLLWLAHAAENANVAFMPERYEPQFLMKRAQEFVDLFPGLLVGNLTGVPELRLWGRDGAGGAGIFFCPLVVVAVVDAVRRRRFGVVLFVLFELVLLAPRGLEFLSELARGPLSGTRWTWRFTITVLPPIAVAVALGARPRPDEDATFEPWRPRPKLVLASVLLGLVVLWRGASFDLATVWWNHRIAGTKGMFAEAERFAKSLRAPARVALVGRHQLLSDGSPVPLAYLGLIGNAPLLVPGLETAHLHEPMESEAAAKQHHRLGTPWRVAVSQDFTREQPELAKKKLEAIGVTALVALDPTHLPEDAETRPFRSSDGLTLWVRELSPSPPYPFRGSGQRLPSGALLAPSRANVRPTRPLDAKLTPNGWLLSPPVPWLYVVSGALGVVAAVGLLVLPRRRRAPGSATAPAEPISG
jgi:hypothetical protein